VALPFAVIYSDRASFNSQLPRKRASLRIHDSVVMRVLIIEDELRLSRHIASALIEAGHNPMMVHDGETAIGQVQEEPFELVILDVMLPGMNGFEVLRRIRALGITCRVIMLTARGEIDDRVTGLSLGADDYLAKPFAMQELVARVDAVGRRYAEKPDLILRVDDLTLNLAEQQVKRGSRSLKLSIRELTLLKVLMREPGRVFTRTELCERVWQRKHEYDTKLVEVFIGRLRRKMGPPPLIQTLQYIGYSIGEPK
jgi:DNA-binding response OmpR family regulator